MTSTGNADLPLAHGKTGLLTIAVWEYDYYLDHQNDRGAFVDTDLDKPVNREFATKNLDAAL